MKWFFTKKKYNKIKLPDFYTQKLEREQSESCINFKISLISNLLSF